ncbi:MAG: oligoendopeptidase F [Planctomycetota bacterium]
MNARGLTVVAACLLMAGATGLDQHGGVAPAQAQSLSLPDLGPDDKAPSSPKCGDIDAKYRWNLGDLYADTDAWEKAFRDSGMKIALLAEMKGKLGDSPNALLTILRHRDRTFAELGMVFQYAGLAYYLDMKDADAGSRFERAQSLSTKADEAVSWLVPEILALPEKKVSKWMDENEELAVYRHEFDDIYRQREHVLSAREEELLAMAGDVTSSFNTIFGRFQNTDLDFPVLKDDKGEEFQLSSAKYYQHIYSPDRRLRKDVFLGLHNVYLDKRNTISAILSGQVKQHMFYAKARGFESSLASAVNGPGIPVEVVENLIGTVNKHLPKVHRYTALRKKVMGLDEVHRYDLRLPMFAASEDDVAYDDAKKTILAALQPMGDDYIATATKAFESRWLDVYETPNKESGAFSWGTPLAPHPFMLLNYLGTRNDRSTVAHELGHTMHSWYTTRNQPLPYAGYASFCAEVASTVNEVLLSEYLMNHAKDDMERLLILQEQIEGIRTTVIRQTMFAEFEKTIHEQAEAGEALTGDSLCDTYGKIVQKYYGPDLVLDECAKAEGLRIPHFYRNFYVYTYATSHCAATNIGRRIIAEEPGAVEGHMKFLSAGSSKYPLDVLKLAGVDMTTPRPIEDTMELFAKLLDEFEALHAKHEAG